MTDTRMLPGHEAARALAVAVATLRTSPPAGMEAIATLAWHSIHSISWTQSENDPVIVVETMRQRQAHGSRSVLRATLTADHPSRAAFDAAVTGLTTLHADATLTAKVMVAFIGWEVTVSQDLGAEGERITPWGCEESLAVTGGEWPDFIVQRDADMRDRGMYAANAFIRIAGRLEQMVSGQEENYHRHWTRVDAEILRRAAIREHPALDPDFVPRIALAA